MNEPVQWLPDGSPYSPRFDDRYRSRTGGAAQAMGVFLGGCGLPAAWHGRAGFTVLETGFGLGVNFLATWAAWEADPQRCATLHFVSVEAYPVAAQDLVHSARHLDPPPGSRGAALAARSVDAATRALHPRMAELAEQLAAAWWGLTPGIHRLRFADGRVHLTLAVGEVLPMLKALVCQADAVYLDGFDPEHNPQMWEAPVLQAVARHCRVGARLASWTVALPVREALRPLGFQVEKAPGVPPKRHRLQAVFAPAWPLRRALPPAAWPTQAIVIGAGLAGAHVAHELARRGWQVRVLDAAAAPAAGASGLPVGLMANHISPDDAPLSRASRAGVRAARDTLQRLSTAGLLRVGADWCASGVLEQQRDRTKAPHPAHWSAAAAADWMADGPGGLQHRRAAWVKPHALVRALLQHPNIRFEGGHAVARLVAQDHPTRHWQVWDPHGQNLGEAPLVVLCAASGSAALLDGGERLPLDAVAGQAVLAPWTEAPPCPTPLNGDGHFIPGVPLGPGVAWASDAAPAASGCFWLSGATYERLPLAQLDAAAGLATNHARLQRLLQAWPDWAAQVDRAFAEGVVQVWRGQRCTISDRLPLVGEWADGLHLCTALGSRGLSFSALCAELLVARLHGEPLALEQRLVQALDASRPFAARKARAGAPATHTEPESA